MTQDVTWRSGCAVGETRTSDMMAGGADVFVAAEVTAKETGNRMPPTLPC
jgi:hypothetical protein